MLKGFHLLVLSSLVSIPVLAHNVEISDDVAATFHITPNHNPQTGEKALAWFALTRRGGEIIPLSECHCSLNIYPLPREADTEPILQPSLSAINVEKYQEIPSAEIIFPQPGAYELEIIGTPKEGNDFSSFKLSYSVNVRP